MKIKHSYSYLAKKDLEGCIAQLVRIEGCIATNYNNYPARNLTGIYELFICNSSLCYIPTNFYSYLFSLAKSEV